MSYKNDSTECQEILQFDDDAGIKRLTFHCVLEAGHESKKHMVRGIDREGKEFELIWVS